MVLSLQYPAESGRWLIHQFNIIHVKLGRFSFTLYLVRCFMVTCLSAYLLQWRTLFPMLCLSLVKICLTVMEIVQDLHVPQCQNSHPMISLCVVPLLNEKHLQTLSKATADRRSPFPSVELYVLKTESEDFQERQSVFAFSKREDSLMRQIDQRCNKCSST